MYSKNNDEVAGGYNVLLLFVCLLLKDFKKIIKILKSLLYVTYIFKWFPKFHANNDNISLNAISVCNDNIFSKKR